MTRSTESTFERALRCGGLTACVRCGEEPEGPYEHIGDDCYCEYCAELYLEELAADAAEEAASLADNAEHDRLYQAEKVAA